MITAKSIRRVTDIEISNTSIRVIVTGVHSKEWSVTLKDNKSIKTTTFSGRVAALKEYKRIINNLKLYV